jgi:hypothetical protein
MAFDFKKAQKEAANDIKNTNLGLMVLGQSGAGKSTLAGTFGVKTLYLYTTGESHGAKAAATIGSDNISPVSINVENGTLLSADKAYERLLSILSSVEEIKAEGFKSVVVDGATELEILIRETSRWKLMCQTDKGTHNSWAEGKATLAMFRPVVDGLKSLQRTLGIHFMMTCALDVISVDDNGEIQESKPRLQTYSVAEGVIQQFEDIVVVGRMSNGDKVGHRLQFLAGVSRESKDAAGNVRKSINFNPRLSGVTLDKLPNTVKADVQELIKLKKGA